METNYLPKNLAFSILSLVLISFATYAQVGIGTTDPKTTLEVDGALSLREGTALPLNNGTNDNISLGTTPYSLYRITGPTAAFTITGIAPSTGADGQIITLVNTTSYVMTIAHDASSTAPNRIYCPNETNVVLTGRYSVVTFQYNKSLTKWILTGTSYGEVNENPIDSVTLAADYSLGAGAFSDVPAMSLTFVARKTSVLIMLTGSGNSTQIAVAICDFQVLNVTSGTTIGGTHEKMTTFDNLAGLAEAWSLSFTKPLNGLTIGNTYTLKVQAFLDPIAFFIGPPPALQIFPVTFPIDHHLTLSVIQ